MAEKKEIKGSDAVPEIHRNVDPNDLPPHGPTGAGKDSSDGDSDDRMQGDATRAEGFGAVKGVGGRKGQTSAPKQS